MVMKTLPRSLDFAAALALSNYNDARVLAASTAETIPVPVGAVAALITTKGGYDLWVNSVGGAAVIPSGDVVDGSAAQLILTPQLVGVGGLDSISVIADGITTVSIAWFSKPA